MTKNKFTIFAVLTFSIFLFSCSKDEMKLNDVNDNTNDVYIDGQSAQALPGNLCIDDLFVVRVFQGATNEEKVYYFTTEEQYVSFGNQLGYDFKSHLEFEKEMNQFAEQKGLCEMSEEIDSLPQWYYDYERTAYEKYFKPDASKSFFVVLHKDANGGGSSNVMVSNYAFMPPGWNNCVSSVKFVGIAGGLHVYDKSLYRKRVETVVGLADQIYNLGRGNNKMSSGVRFY